MTNYNNEFCTINSEFKAYYLGLFYSDGCMSQNKITISLQEKDKEILSILQKEFPFFNLKKRIQKRENTSDTYELYRSSSKLYNDLLALGCLPRKSFENKDKIKIPEMDSNFIRHFIRGYFDGDGSISKFTNRNLYSFSIVSVGKNTIFFFQEEFKKSNIITQIRTRGIEPKYKCFQDRFEIICNKSSELFKIKEYFYKNATIFLQRKKETFDKVIVKKSSQTFNVFDYGNRGLACPKCNSHFISKMGKRQMKSNIAYRFYCNSCNKLYTTYTAPFISNGKSGAIQP